MKQSIKHFRSVVFIGRQTRVLDIFPLLLQFFELPFFIFDLHFSTPLQCLLPPTIATLSPGPCTTTLLVPVSNQENPPETIWHAVNIVTCIEVQFFFDSLVHVIFRYYFTGYREWVVYYCSYQLISDWFPNKKSYSKNKSCVMVFFSYQTNTGTKHELPAGDQCWKCSRQCSAFGCIGDQ